MIRISTCTTLLLTAAIIAASAAATQAQAPSAFSTSGHFDAPAAAGAASRPAAAGSTTSPPRHSFDMSAMFATEYAGVASQNSGNFWMNGGAADASFNVLGGLGIAADFSVDTAGNVGIGGSANKVQFAAGPRYTIEMSGSHSERFENRIFVEALGGIAHGYNGLYPSSTGVQNSASSSAVLIGGGYDLGLRGGWGLRLLDAAWVRTMLPNGAANVQSDLRLGFGLSYRMGKNK